MANEDLFEKVCILKCANDIEWELPLIELCSVKHHLKDAKVEELKNALNNLKGSLNDFEIGIWHKHTTYCNPAALVNKQIRQYFHPELCTQAWCKFHEILCFDQVLPEFALSSKSVCAVHLCEAPGAFICSLNHYLKSHHRNVKYSWLACTLNPYYEGNDADSCVADDRLIFRTLDQWCFGPDNTGNIFSKSLLEDVCKKATAFDTVCLVTADGSFNCQKNPAEQELDTSKLKFTEMLYALSILDMGGSFVLKIFTALEYTSIQLLYVLCCTFDTVRIRKPATSKPGNSELYVVAKGYKKLDSRHPLLIELRRLCVEESGPVRLELFGTNTLPSDFVTKYKSCVEKFVQYQMDTIQHNIQRYGQKHSSELDEVHQTVAAIAIEQMGLKNIPGNQCIIKSGILRKPLTSNIDLRPKMSGTFMERKLLVKTENMSAPRQDDLTWITWKPAEFKYNVELTFGKPLHNVRTSLFCETDKLVAMNHSEGINFSGDRYVETTEKCTTVKCLKEMVLSGNGQVFEAEISVDERTCVVEVLRQAGHELLHSTPLKLSSQVTLSAGSLLLASLLKSTSESTVIQEVLCFEDFLKLVIYALRNSRPGANLVVVLPSALTRLTAGLLFILQSVYTSHTLTTVNNYYFPGLVIFFRNFTEGGRYITSLEMALHQASELPDDQSLLGILSVFALLQDERYVKLLKKHNHAIISAHLRRREDGTTK